MSSGTTPFFKEHKECATAYLHIKCQEHISQNKNNRKESFVSWVFVNVFLVLLLATVVNFKRSVVVSALFILSFTKLMCYYQRWDG